MTPSEIRTELLAQHAGLRVLIGETRKAVERLPEGSTGREALRASIERLTSALRVHNGREEAVLREILKSVDAWGPVRVEIMDETHVREHTALLTALTGTSAVVDPAVAQSHVVNLLDRLEVHMAREEDVLLAENVLRDDDIAIESMGG